MCIFKLSFLRSVEFYMLLIGLIATNGTILPRCIQKEKHPKVLNIASFVVFLRVNEVKYHHKSYIIGGNIPFVLQSCRGKE